MMRKSPSARSWDFSPIGRSRIVAVVVAGVVFSAAVASGIVSYTTEFMDPNARRLTWIAAIAMPVLVSGPVFYCFASKLRQLAILHRELLFTSTHDHLTNCLNRGAFVA